MKPIQTFHVRPSLPERLRPLEEIAYNLRWSWDHETIDLFRRLDRDLWETTGHNPVRLLGDVPQERLVEAADDEGFLAHLDRVHRDLDEYLAARGTWSRRAWCAPGSPVVAYFSMEFGITECLPIYSGGLGILAGDHLKSASDLGIPLVAVGLLYQKGYFRQYLSSEGWQQERYPVNDFSTLPVRPMRDARGEPLRIQVDLAGRPIVARIWRAQVGRVDLLLLDANIPENPPEMQDVTDELYGGDVENRIRQEIVLGVGGVRALEAAGLAPRVFHLNEGHCAFLVLERMRRLVRDEGLGVEEALEAAAAGTVFTTHTPVPAGIDVFPPEAMDRYFGAWRQELGVARESLLDLGRTRPGDASEGFSMAVLAIRTSAHLNGVSRLHARVSRRMWSGIWPGLPEEEIPIGHVTNGVHPGSWISGDMRGLYDRYLGPRWSEEPGDARVWGRSEQIPGEELWRTHERRRERLVAFARRRLGEQLRRRGAGSSEIAQAEEVLDPEALTIGFARRFATYKRAALVLSDADRLERILNAPGRPVQILFAGKAHPRDDDGKRLILRIVQTAARAGFRRRIVFLEDYDSVTARYLVQGVDVWLNTPRRPMEASGTSGMKAAANGALNLSVLDGWWDEACAPRTGWSIGLGEEHGDPSYQDRIEAGILYERLEREVVPLFYARGADGLPRGWIEMMRTAMGDLCPVFNTNRMVCQYVTEAYRPAEARLSALRADGWRRARELARWRARVREAWPRVRVERVEADLPRETRVGDPVEIRAIVVAGGLEPRDVAVEVCVGRVDENQSLVEIERFPMEPADGAPAKTVEIRYRATYAARTSGTRGFTVRVAPRHPDLARAPEGGLVVWAA